MVSLPIGSPERTNSSTTARRTAALRAPSSPRCAMDAVLALTLRECQASGAPVRLHLVIEVISRADGFRPGTRGSGELQGDLVRQQHAALGEHDVAVPPRQQP